MIKKYKLTNLSLELRKCCNLRQKILDVRWHVIPAQEVKFNYFCFQHWMRNTFSRVFLKCVILVVLLHCFQFPRLVLTFRFSPLTSLVILILLVGNLVPPSTLLPTQNLLSIFFAPRPFCSTLSRVAHGHWKNTKNGTMLFRHFVPSLSCHGHQR